MLFSLDPETAHHITLALLSLLSRLPVLLKLFPDQVRAEREVFGIRFPNPVGLAAGFDKNAVAVSAWHALGFGFVEVGTVTAQSQPGNPRPRVFRIPELEAIVNRLGFNNDGAEKVANRLVHYRKRKAPLGINIGKTRSVPLEAAIADYVATFQRLQDLGDYFVLNVSSPNTPGLRELQERKALKELLSAIQQENTSKPLLIKIAPDLDCAQIDAVIEVALERQIAGLIATNTTLNHDSIPLSKRQTGGLSGAPLGERSLAVLSYIRSRCSLPLIAVGGIMDADDAMKRFDAGANLVQLYTGLVYRGPSLIRSTVKSIADRVGHNRTKMD